MAIKVVVLVFNFGQALIESWFFTNKVSNVRLSFVTLVLYGLNRLVNVGILSPLSLEFFSSQNNLALDSVFFHFKKLIGRSEFLPFDLALGSIVLSSAAVLDKLLRFSFGVF